MRTLLVDICRAYREWLPEILTLLNSKKVKEREFAVLLLEEWGDPSCLEAVRSALGREKNKKLIASLQELTEELEQELFMPHFRESQKWKELFVDHPVMHPFAMGLIWGVYEDQELKETFRYMGDGTFNTADEEEYPFPESGQIGLVHTLELSGEELAAWKEQLSDHEITQPLEQLERPIFRLKEEEKGEQAVTRFEDQTQNGLSLSGRLLRMGWFRGEILDAGFFVNYYHVDGAFGAELTFSGSSVGYENEEVTIQQLYFYRIAPAESGGAAHGAFQKENRCLPEEVDQRYFSEVLLQVANAVGE